MSNQGYVVPRSEQASQARKHYDRASRAYMEWSSLIPKAIDAWEHEPELEARLSTANAELESMHRELAAAYAVLREIKDIFVGESLAVFFAKTIKSIDDYLSGKEKYSGVYDELADKQAIIDEQAKEIAELHKQSERPIPTIDYYMGKPIIYHFEGEKFYHLENYEDFVKDTLFILPRRYRV